jgi:dethiobiotin synthetase
MITAIQGTQNQIQADYCMIESIGGWFVPLNANETVANVITILQYPVILVVGIKLGCLNHALLTVKQIEQTNIPFIGWIANEIDPNMQMKDENITTLKQWIKAPHLGTIAFNELHPKLDYHALID